MFIVLAVIAFGILIAVHELGHFTAAKLLGVKVNEFAIGMGPKLLKKQGKETMYTLRLLPFGGFCAMEGEDEAMEDSRAFTSQKGWRRVIILAAGAAANFIAGFIIVLILTSKMTLFGGTTIMGLVDGFPLEGEHGFMIGDTIVSINGEKLYYTEDFSTFMSLDTNGAADFVVNRGGETITLKDFPLEKREYMIEGELLLRYGIDFNKIEGSVVEKLKYSCYTAMNFVRLIRVSLAQLISGAAGVNDLSGPVGIVSAMNEIGQSSGTLGAALANIAYFTAFIAVNLAVMNLLPIPALDGGRIVFIFITWVIERITRRRVDPKYEGYVHTAAMVLLMGLMVFILVNDVVKIIGK